jgi:DNA-binding response OmpR family regulator
MPLRPTQNSQNEAAEPILEPPHRILLLDDDPLVVESLEAALRSAGHEVRSSVDGKDAFRLLDLLQPNLVITDVIMSEIDTIDTIAEMRRSRPGVKIIAISGNPHLLTLAVKHGADHILAKPFGVHQLNVLVRVALQ